MLSLPDINLCGRYFKSQKIGARPTGPAFRSGQIVSRRPRPDPIDRLRFRECNKQDETATGRPFSCGVSFPAHLFYADEARESFRPIRSRFRDMPSTGKRRSEYRASCQREGCRGKAVSGTLKSIAAESYFSNRSIRSRNSISRRMLSMPVTSASTRRSATYLPPV